MKKYDYNISELFWCGEYACKICKNGNEIIDCEECFLPYIINPVTHKCEFCHETCEEFVSIFSNNINLLEASVEKAQQN